MLKNLLKSGTDLARTLPDLLTDLVKDIALLGKSAFNKQIGIEPIVPVSYTHLTLPTKRIV